MPSFIVIFAPDCCRNDGQFDQGYYPDTLTEALEAVYPQVMGKLNFERAPKPSKADKAA